MKKAIVFLIAAVVCAVVQTVTDKAFGVQWGALAAQLIPQSNLALYGSDHGFRGNQ